MLKVLFHVRNSRTAEEHDVTVSAYNEEAAREALARVLRGRGARDLDLLDTRICWTKVETV